MTGDSPRQAEYDHQPVMVPEVLDALAPAAGEVCLDVTVGLGGHAAALMPLMPGGVYVGLDRDREALAQARTRLTELTSECRLELVNAPFADARIALRSLRVGQANMVLGDFGVSSMQLDHGDRGFSWRKDAPLDLRMDTARGEPAWKVLAHADVDELAEVLRRFGEVRNARRIARAILEHPPRTTRELAEIAGHFAPPAARNRHLARIFQALRIWVNDELAQIERLLGDVPAIVAPGARVAFLSYHSLEDRLVKRAMQSWEGRCTCPPEQPVCRCGAAPLGTRLNRRPLRPSDGEVSVNPRARSAKLRAFRFLEAA
ncbi:MAG: 16S rRNA (cytosine(1402)-N(4))-methyltransferase RsmH [Candidatus Dadabacteria bacterium]|nr:MAG: 16S rRNA (cytosine(1402)-N(4))-methyltransferase RsmH [Candidatus Dadabacteria bacterium]